MWSIKDFETEYRQNYDKVYLGRLGKTFKTHKHYYYYDMGTGKIAQITYPVYLVLKTLLEDGKWEDLQELKLSKEELFTALDDIRTGIKNEHILSAYPLRTLNGLNNNILMEKLNSSMEQMILEVTEQCNLRCKYCIYHPSHPEFRSFGKKNMSKEVAFESIDYFLQHSFKSEEVMVTFYGGEPLINFQLIKEVVEYSKKEAEKKRRNILFGLTTNGTLIDEQIADFLVKNDFNIVLSVDGSEKMHNENRIYPNGKGSFRDTLQGMRKIIKARIAQGKNEEPMVFSMVIPNGELNLKYDEIQRFFDDNSWFPDNLQVLTSPVEYSPKETAYILPQSEEERSLYKGLISPLSFWSDKKLSEGKEHLFCEGGLDKELLRIHNRFYVDEPNGIYGMNGCCVPGSRRVYVSTDGKFYLCEKVGNMPSIGDVDHGFDFEKIQKYYVDDFIQETKKYCKDCWAVNICGQCYMNCYDSEGVNMAYRHESCREERFSLENTLVRYHQMMEEHPESLKKLDAMELS